MHVVLVNRWYPPHTGYGGVAMYNYYLAHGLVRAGHRVTVIAARWSKAVPPLHDDHEVAVHRLLGLSLEWGRRLPILGRHTRALSLLIYSARVAWFLRKLQKRQRIDIVEFADIEAEGFIYVLFRRRCPVVVRCHTPSFVLRRYYRDSETPYSTTMTAAFEKTQIRRADALTVPSYDMAKTIARVCGLATERFSVIPNAVDIEMFNGSAAAKAAAPDAGGGKGEKVLVLYVGRMERAKGVGVLAQAIPMVLEKRPHARFHFVGEARAYDQERNWQQHLESYFGHLGLESCVEFFGTVDQATLLSCYARAEIAVVPSLLYESFSYTCVQAMAAGVPVVASRIGGIPETVEDGVSGILTQPGNAEELADAICVLAADADLRSRLGAAGRLRAQQKFSTEMVVKKTLEVYRGLVGGANTLREANSAE
jgi:glycosyltransferase involved in cell wall biosynthesis